MGTFGRMAIALVAFFSSWAAFLPIGFGFTPITLSVVVAMMFAMFAVAQRLVFRVRPIDLWFLAFMSVLWLSAIFADNTESALQGWRIWLASFLGYAATRILFRTERSLGIVVWAGVFGTIVTSLNIAPTVNEWGDIGRAAVEGLNTNFTAYAITGYLYVFLLFINLRTYSRSMRLVQLGIIAFVVSILLTLETRGALISTGAMLIYWVFAARIPVILVRIGLVLVTGWSLLLAFGYLDFLLLLLDGSGERATGDLAGRGTIWTEAREIFFANWLLGIGPGQFFFVSDRGVGAHNFFLTVGLDSGVTGLGLILGFLFALARILSGARLGPRQINLGVMFYAYWIPIALSGHWELSVWSWVVVAVSVQMAGFATKAQPRPPVTPSPLHPVPKTPHLAEKA